jgi:hypothetical protein
VLSLLRLVQGKSFFYLFTEDDFVLCPNGLLALSHFIRKALDYQRTFSALRCGIGLNGIVMQNGGGGQTKNDLRAFADFLEANYPRRPPDHLVVEFFAKESQAGKQVFAERHPMAFRYNLFAHLGGEKSTLRSESAWALPGCFEELVEPQVFQVEAWSAADCPEDDVWPCRYNNAGDTQGMVSWQASGKSVEVANLAP